MHIQILESQKTQVNSIEKYYLQVLLLFNSQFTDITDPQIKITKESNLLLQKITKIKLYTISEREMNTEYTEQLKGN